MPWVGFEPTIPAFARAKSSVYALDRAATVISLKFTKFNVYYFFQAVWYMKPK
jgi:hypothetical protein